MAVDSAANYYVTDDKLVWRVDRLSNEITLLAGTGSRANFGPRPDSGPSSEETLSLNGHAAHLSPGHPPA
ncbi:MAG: hypothetical protein FJW39_32945 [Acidobacteria bacterium]|nr:hypothetical protein [Acidobacteriota bacterium]